MKQIGKILFLLFILTSIFRVDIYGKSSSAGNQPASEYLYDYLFFDNSPMVGFYYYTKTSYTTPSWIKNMRNRLPVSEVFFSLGNSLELTYTSSGEGEWYCEVQHQPVRGVDFFRIPDVLSLQLFMEEDFDIKALPTIAIRYRDSTYARQLRLADYIPGRNAGTWYNVRIPLIDFGIKAVNGTNIKTYYGLKLDVGVSNGGPLFFIHYPYLGLDPHHFTDRFTNYFHNNQTIAQINYRYCVENPGNYVGYGADCWGLTASDFAWGYQAQEPVPFRDNGTVAPTGALASFPYTPGESMAALKNYYRNYGHFLWGEYGFRDAFNLTENWCSSIFMGLNQAPITVMIENYRSGLIWELFMSHPDVKKGIEKINRIK